LEYRYRLLRPEYISLFQTCELIFWFCRSGADTERSGTGWDDLLYNQLPTLKSVLRNKKVAVFGLGDQDSYAENYADAAGELFDVFEGLDCEMVPYAATSQDGYEHQSSKSIRGDKFCGLLLDQVNQEELTDDRVEAWVAQLKAGGFLEGADSISATTIVDGAAAAGDSLEQLESENNTLKETLEQSSTVLDQNIGSHSSGGFTPHHNPLTGKTMWTSADGRSSYVTTTDVSIKLRP